MFSGFLKRQIDRQKNWQKGRQKTGYDKKLLFFIPLYFLAFDAYLLRFSKGSYIPKHVDTVDRYHHYRLNIVINSSFKGGEFVCEKAYLNTKRIKFFKSDSMPHSVCQVEEGTRLVLSIGLAVRRIFS